MINERSPPTSLCHRVPVTRDIYDAEGKKKGILHDPSYFRNLCKGETHNAIF